MPRLNNGLETLATLSSVKKYTIASGGGDTTLSGALAAAAAVASFTSTTGFLNGDPFCIVGSGGTELNAVNGTPAAAMPLQYKSAFAQASGARVVEMIAADMGYIGDGGVSFGPSLELNPVRAANSRIAIAYVKGNGELTAQFSLLGFNLENAATFFGIPESSVTGTGTSADPYQLAISGLTLGSEGLLCFRMQGVREDLKNVLVDFCGVQLEIQGNIVVGSGQPAVFPMSMKYQNLVMRLW